MEAAAHGVRGVLPPNLGRDGVRPKLGLALAGGGFRASLFHLGVLHRMAELDLLRRVEVLSTVSGGSIVGALYYLKLKQAMERVPQGDLSREQYVLLIHDVHRTVVRAVRKNLRNRLFRNPLALLWTVVTGYTLSQRMARLYERYLFREVVDALQTSAAREGPRRPGFLPLSALRINPRDTDVGTVGIEAFNERRVREGKSCIPRLILNATTLNSGGRFWFSAAEFGDWYLGTTRQDEVQEVAEWKRLLEHAALLDRRKGRVRPGDQALLEHQDPRAVQLARWFLGLRAGGPSREDREDVPRLEGWEALQGLPGFPEVLEAAEIGALRRAKIHAWYLRRERAHTRGAGEAEPAVQVAMGDVGARWDALQDALARIDEGFSAGVRKRIEQAEGGRGGRVAGELLDFVYYLYLARTAVALSRSIATEWDRIGIGDAVGASACFPPVFAPYLIKRVFDEGHVGRLGLTDGGVHDNMGITALRDEGCTEVVASDTGGVFTIKTRSSAGRLGMALRLPSVLMVSLARSQRMYLRERRRSCAVLDPVVRKAPDPEGGNARAFHAQRALEKLAFFHIESSAEEPLHAKDGPAGELGSVPPLALAVRGAALARLRTDLDAFGDVEVAALVNRGYDLADRYLRGYGLTQREEAPTRPDGEEPPRVAVLTPPTTPCPGVKGARVNAVVRAGRHRLWRSIRLRDPPARAAVAVGIVAAVVGLLLAWPWIRSTGWALLQAGARGWWQVLWHGWGLLIPGVALLLALAVLLERLVGGEWMGTLRTTQPKLARGIGRLAGGARNGVGNLLWLVPPLPILYVLGVSASSWLGLWFSRRFLAVTRIHGEDLYPWALDASEPHPWKEPVAAETRGEPEVSERDRPGPSGGPREDGRRHRSRLGWKFRNRVGAASRRATGRSGGAASGASPSTRRPRWRKEA